MTKLGRSAGRNASMLTLLIAMLAVTLLTIPLPLSAAAPPSRYPSSINITTSVPYHQAISQEMTGEACLSSIFDMWGPYIPQQDIRNVTKGKFESGVAEPEEIIPAATFSHISRAQANLRQWGYEQRDLGYGGFQQDWSDDSPRFADRFSDLKSIVGGDPPMSVMLFMYLDMPPTIDPPSPPPIPDPSNPPTPQPPTIDPKVTPEELSALGKQWRLVVGYSGTTFRIMDPWPSEGFATSNKDGKSVYDVSLTELDLLWNVTTRNGGTGFGTHRIALTSCPFIIDPNIPKKVNAGNEFVVEANITYFAPPNMDGASLQSPPAPTANLIIPEEYAFVNSTMEQTLYLTTPRSYQVVAWTVKAPDKEVAGQDITFKLNATGYIHPEVDYRDHLGSETAFDIPVKGFVNYAPVIKNASVSPNRIPNDGTVKAFISCQATDPNSNLGEVYVDLTSVKGSATQRMYDNGKDGGDKVADDNVYSYTLMKDSYPKGENTLVIYAKDQQGAQDSEPVKLVVYDPFDETEPPVFIASGAIPYEVPNDGMTPTILWAKVSDKEDDIKKVTVDLTPIGGETNIEMFPADPAANDGNYSVQALVSPATPLGRIDLELSALDELSHEATYQVRIDVVMPPADPIITAVSLDPATVPNDGRTKVLLEAVASDINDDIDKVSADLTLVGGSRTAVLKFQGDDVYSIEFVVPSTIPAGSKRIEVTVTDSTGRSVTSSDTLKVEQSNKPPEIVDYSSGTPDGKVRIGDKVIVTVNVTDPEGKVSKVELDLTQMSLGTIVLLDDGNPPDIAAGDGIYSGSYTVSGNLSGAYNITLRVTDSAGAQATVTIPLLVVPKEATHLLSMPKAVFIGAPVGIAFLILGLVVVSAVLSSRRKEPAPMPSQPVFRPMGPPPSRFTPVPQGPR